MKTLVLVRHGEAGEARLNEVSFTPKNEYDHPLTPLGLSQAQKLAEVFVDETFDYSFSSDYLRAVETFEQLNVQSKNHAVTPDIREIFCECIGRNFGNTDLAEFKNQKARVHRFIEQHLTNLPDGQRVLVVAHGCLILYMLTLLTGKTFGHEMTHTGVTTLEFTTHWELVSFNDSAHLYEPVATEITQALAEPVTQENQNTS